MMRETLSLGEWVEKIEISDRLRGSQNQEFESQLPLGPVGRQHSRIERKTVTPSPLAPLLYRRDLKGPLILQGRGVEGCKQDG